MLTSKRQIMDILVTYIHLKQNLDEYIKMCRINYEKNQLIYKNNLFTGFNLDKSYSQSLIMLRHLNEAFFILSWGVIDNYIDLIARELIKKKQSSLSWEEKRGFLIYNVNDKKLSGLSLEEKVDLLINKDTDLSLNKKIKQLYKSRNLIAHGKEYSQSIDLFEFDGLINSINKAITL